MALIVVAVPGSGGSRELLGLLLGGALCKDFVCPSDAACGVQDLQEKEGQRSSG